MFCGNKEALRLGYKIVEVYEMIIWDKRNQTNKLFTNFLSNIIKGKTYASFNKEDENIDKIIKENQEAKVPFEGLGQDWNFDKDSFNFKAILDKNKFKKNQATRQMYKLLANSRFMEDLLWHKIIKTLH